MSDFLRNVTALVLTYNEAPNIGRTLAKLDGFARVVVIDSGSDDATLDIVGRHANADVLVRPFDSFAGQWNFALANARIDTEWVLSLDADFVLTDELVREIDALSPPVDVEGYRVAFRYCVFGRPIRSGVYPPLVALYRRARAAFAQEGHSQRLILQGRIVALAHPIRHDDRKPLARWLDAQRTYAQQDAEHLETAEPRDLKWQDRIRLAIGIAPPLMFVYVFVLRGGLLDGWHGLFYALQRAFAELLLSLELLERKLRRMSR